MHAKFSTTSGLRKMEKLSELPFVFQVVTGFGLFVGAIGVMILGWLKKNFKVGELFNSEHKSSDAVILNAAIADTNSINALAGSIDRLVDFLREDAEDDGHQMKRNRDVLCEIRDSVDSLATVVKKRTIV